MTTLPRRIVLLGLIAGTAGCGLLSSPVPPSLFTLTPPTALPPGPPVHGQLLIDAPAAVAALDTERIALARSLTSIDYFADSAWSDRAPLLVQGLLIQAFENSRRITAIGRESLALRADVILTPELRHFEARYDGTAEPLVSVELGVRLVKLPERAIIAQRSFAATLRAGGDQVPAIVDAFNQALQTVLTQTVGWTLMQMAGVPQ